MPGPAQLLQTEDSTGTRRNVGGATAAGQGALRIIAPDAESLLALVRDRLDSILAAGGITVIQTNEPAPAPVKDRYLEGEVLPDQVGTGGVLTFTFSEPVDLIWCRVDGGGAGRADPFGGIPTADRGIYVEPEVPAPLTVTTTTVRVFAPTGTVVRVHGYRY